MASSRQIKGKLRGVDPLERVDESRTLYRVRLRKLSPIDGKPKDRVFKVAATTPRAAKVEAERLFVEAERDAMRAAERKAMELRRPPTLGTHASTWLGYKRSSVKHATLELWLAFAKKIVDDPIGDKRLDELTTKDIDDWRRRQLAAKSSAVTVNQRMRFLGRIWRSAVKKYPTTITPHAVDFDELGMLPEQPKAKTWLTAEQLADLLAALRRESPQWHALVFTMAATGMRAGEVTALRKEDIDFAGQRIVISRSHYRGVEGTPKNGRIRTAPIVEELAEVLHAHCATLEREKDPGWREEGLLFSAPLPGKRYSLRPAATLRKPLAKAAAAAGIRGVVSAHTFRRTFVNLMRQKAEGLVVRDIVGHASEAMTNRYSKVDHAEKLGATVHVLGPILGRSLAVEKRGPDVEGPETTIPRDAAEASKGAG